MVGNNRTILFCCLLILGSASLKAMAGADAVELKRTDNQIEITIGGRPFTTYYFDAKTAKAYFQPLRSAQGTIVTRGFPMETNIPDEDHDEPHQRAMYFAHGDIDGYDFWGEAEFPRWSRHSRATFGGTVFRKLDEVRGSPDSGVLRAEFDPLTNEDDGI